MSLVALLVVAGAAAQPGVSALGPQEVGRLEGIWKMCYEPGLDDVVEIDEGYLVLMPDSRYYELEASCCYEPDGPQPPFWQLGEYRVRDDSVILETRTFHGSHNQVTLTHRAPARAVFFDDPRGDPVEVEALLPGEDLNYAWCRVYPRPR